MEELWDFTSTMLLVGKCSYHLEKPEDPGLKELLSQRQIDNNKKLSKAKTEHKTFVNDEKQTYVWFDLSIASSAKDN